jgi:glutathione S-transferase
VTLQALVDAPGLEVVGGLVEIGASGFFAALSDAFTAIAENRSHLRGPESRLRRLPIVDTCNSTGLPAALLAKVGSSSRTLGLEAAAKRAAADEGLRAMAVPDVRSRRGLDELDDDEPGRWSAIVHADGNGLGQLFLAFDEHLERAGWLVGDVIDDADAYATLSRRIEHCTRTAWARAAKDVANDGIVDLVPVLLGGDDITVVAGGSVALPFAQAYLHRFAEAVDADEDLRSLDVGGLTASAAVVWTKPGYPYSSAYQLAEQRLKAAKQAAAAVAHPGPSSAVIDVFVLYDTVAEMVDRRALDDPAVRLSANPYAVDEMEGLRSLDQLRSLATMLAVPAAPSSQVHEVREVLTTVGAAAASRRLDELKSSHPALHGAVHPLVDGDRIMLLDAMDLADASKERGRPYA